MIVDQFEELFTLSDDDGRQEEFVAELTELAGAAGLAS